MSPRRGAPPALPRLINQKLYKTGQTRGADDDEIFQNRVLRCGTVLIPYDSWPSCWEPDDGTGHYENGFIVLVSPRWYFETAGADRLLAEDGLSIGTNAAVFYRTRVDWNAYPPRRGWVPATSRLAPIDGQYVARVAATTAEEHVRHGFATSSSKGAGIRVYEYASATTIAQCRRQLECLLWLCADSVVIMEAQGMDRDAAVARRDAVLAEGQADGLLDLDRMAERRMVDAAGITICPLCRQEMSPREFMTRLEQAEGRATPDITITAVSLFHIDELRVGRLSHVPYNLGWGHHHCNVVVKDSGIVKTLDWMYEVLLRNDVLVEED